MNYQFSFHPISRKFIHPVITNHGIWEIRESIILSLTDELGKIGWGEIAPISWFGSETLTQALDFCHQLPAQITTEQIFAIPDELPTCQFGFESALEGVGKEVENFPNLSYSGLLPAGSAALQQWQDLWQNGYRTFKWKIAVHDILLELEIFQSLIQALPSSAKLRLDANGGLSYEQTKLWLESCDNFSEKIEFIEQPLPVTQFVEMQELSKCYQTRIALDESVANLQQLEYLFQQDWKGIFVIKPGIVGSPSRLRKFCQHNNIDVVFSSVFETEIGRQAALKLAGELSHNHRAVGFGINYFLAAT